VECGMWKEKKKTEALDFRFGIVDFGFRIWDPFDFGFGIWDLNKVNSPILYLRP
jgi:hypothetical protein